MVQATPKVDLFGIEVYRPHAEQLRLYRSPARFQVTAAGRRSGKTGIHKKRAFRDILDFRHPRGRFFFTAPTHDQARRLYWEDLKRAYPSSFLLGRPRETDMTVELVTGAQARVCGLDRPERLEGDYIDGVVLDEFANMKPRVWTEHIRAGLSSPGRPPGWARFLGVPDFRGPHFRELFHQALDPSMEDWDAFHWVSADILDDAEVEAARRDLDEVTFRQEYEASFVIATGRAYYAFQRDIHAREALEYHPHEDLSFAFDFNVEPGVAAVLQEQDFRRGRNKREDRRLVADRITAAIGEVWIPKDSNTERVCARLIHDWGHHKGRVLCYGDATGGARGSAKVAGSDWDLIRKSLRRHFGKRVSFRVPKGNPPERARVNAVNARLRTADKMIHFLVDPARCPHICDDLELVALLEGGTGEIHKEQGSFLTHISDAVGYYVQRRHPIAGMAAALLNQ